MPQDRADPVIVVIEVENPDFQTVHADLDFTGAGIDHFSTC